MLLYGCESWRMTEGDEAKINWILSSTSACVDFEKSVGLCECQMKRCATALPWKLSVNKYGKGGGHGLDTCCKLITVPSYELH